MKEITIENLTKNPYNLSLNGIKIIEEKYNVSYIGVWQPMKNNGSYNDLPLDVFYQENPDIAKGHSNYMGVYTNVNQVFITNAASCFAKTITAIKGRNTGLIYVSNYAHDFKYCRGAGFVDGGRFYTRYDPTAADTISIICKDGKFYEISEEDWD